MTQSLYCMLLAMTLSQTGPSPNVPVLGVEIVSVTEASKQHRRLELPFGAFIKSVAPNGSLDVAGIKDLDVITRIDEIEIKNAADFSKVTSRFKAGEKHEFAGWRSTPSKGDFVWDKKSNWTVFVQSAKESLSNEFLKSIDRNTGVTTFRHADASRSESTQSEFQVFVTRKGMGKPRLNVRIQQVKPANATALAVKEFVIQADDKTFTMTPADGQVKHNSGNGKSWESFTTEVDTTIQKTVDAIAKSKHVIIEAKGENYSNTREISREEISRAAKTLQFFDWWDK